MSVQTKLRELFLVDQQVRGLKQRVDSAANRLTQQQAKLDQFKRLHVEISGQLKLSKVKTAELENDLADMERRINHLREQMTTITSNKEYSALLIEVNTLKEGKAKLEENALNHLGQVDMFSQKLQEVETQVQEQEGLVRVAQTQVHKSHEQIGQQLEDLIVRREEAEQAVPQEAREVFNRMAEVHEGDVMAEVVEENRRAREYSCGGCYMSIPIERVNALMMYSDQVVSCPNCSRVLYLDPQLHESIKPR